MASNHKEIKKDRNFNIRKVKGGIKFDMKWETLKPSLVFNWVMFLGGFSVLLTVIQTVNLNSKFRSFLVRILIRKDNTDNKVFKREFYTKKAKERDRKNKVLQIFVQFAGNLSERVSGKQSSLNLSIFLFFFFCFIEKFQCSLNFESFEPQRRLEIQWTLKLFNKRKPQNSRMNFLWIEFCFIWIFLVELQ